ncbi:MAG: PHP domain-containing protein, partial [Anaerolineaceae bacterium]|nr:PHP domain-containing protein [Anaerolineaceae bacterium]
MMDKSLKVDFHIHTKYSKDSLIDIDKLIAVAKKRHLDRIAITDHNTIQGAIRAQKVDHEMVIIGEEILTEQ